jgi:hypothetical protein
LVKRFIEGMDRGQWTLLPESLDDWISEDNPVRAIDAFVDALDLAELGFKVQPLQRGTGLPPIWPINRLPWRWSRTGKEGGFKLIRRR